MHILGDVEEVFMKGFIRRLDGDQSVIIDVFNESAKAVTAIEGIDMKLFEAFIEGISEDEWGNVVLSTTTSSSDGDESHLINLNYTHHPGRRATETKVEKIKIKAVEIKDKFLQNL